MSIDVLQKAFGGDADPKVAKKNASEVAKLLGSKVVANKKVVLNESYCPFRIAIQSKQFRCFVFVSDVQCRFTAECLVPRSQVGNACFFVSLKIPAPEMFAKTRVGELSTKLGVDVYRQPFSSDGEVAGALLAKRTWDLLRRVDFNHVSQIRLSPIQLGVSYSFQSVTLCAQNALLFRDLISVVFEEAHEKAMTGNR